MEGLHHWLHRSRERLDAQDPALVDTSQHIWQLGSLVFSSRNGTYAAARVAHIHQGLPAAGGP